MSKISQTIETKDISIISKGTLSQESNISHILSTFNEKLSTCPKVDTQYQITLEGESELLKLYSKLPWTEQLKLKTSNLSYYFCFLF